MGGVQAPHRKNITQSIQLTPSLDVCLPPQLTSTPGIRMSLFYTLLPSPSCNAPPPSQRSFLPTLPNTELFLLNFHCIHSAQHILALYGFLNCFISPATLHAPSGQGSAKGVSHQPLQTQLRTQRKNSGERASTPKKDTKSSSDHIQTPGCHKSTLENNRVNNNEGFQLVSADYVPGSRLRIILLHSLKDTVCLLLTLSLL